MSPASLKHHQCHYAPDWGVQQYHSNSNRRVHHEQPRVEVNSATTDQTDGLNSKKKSLKEANGYDIYNKIISEFPSATISDPTEMLRYLQSKIMRGRCLDVTDDASILV